MRSTTLALASLFLAQSIVADVHRHADFHDLAKREPASDSSSTSTSATCSCTTYATTITGQFVLAMPSATSMSASSSSSSSSSASPTSSSSAAAAAAPPPPSPSSDSSPAVAVKAASVKSGGGSGKAMAMAYTPYTNGGLCKDGGAVDSDLAAIKAKGFSSVRVYSTDCHGLESIGNAAAAHGLKMIIGIFINGGGVGGASSQVSDIAAWARWDLVQMLVVGNEAIFNNHCSASDLAGFISSVKQTLSGKGYNGPVTTTEPLGTYKDGNNGQTICAVVDIMGANLHPFFNANTPSSAAGEELSRQIKGVEALCPGKEMFVLETGWPSQGSPNGAAVPGSSQQAEALSGIVSAAGARSVILAYTDDMWKEPGPYGVEQYFGCLKSGVW